MNKHIYVDKITLKTREGYEGSHQELFKEAMGLAFTEWRKVEFEWCGVTQSIDPEEIYMKYFYSEWRDQYESKPKS